MKRQQLLLRANRFTISKRLLRDREEEPENSNTLRSQFLKIIKEDGDRERKNKLFKKIK